MNIVAQAACLYQRHYYVGFVIMPEKIYGKKAVEILLYSLIFGIDHYPFLASKINEVGNDYPEAKRVYVDAHGHDHLCGHDDKFSM